MSKVTASTDFDRIDEESLKKFLALLAEQLVTVLNGNIDFQTNFNCKMLSVTFGAANSDAAVSHGLGRVPTGVLEYSKSAAMIIYNGSVPNNQSVLYLRSSAVGTASVIVF